MRALTKDLVPRSARSARREGWAIAITRPADGMKRTDTASPLAKAVIPGSGASGVAMASPNARE
jgi:hypothetical protein